MRRQLIFFVLTTIFIAGCKPSEAAIQTAIVQTQAAMPTATLIPPTFTPEPIPTVTQIPSPTFEPTTIPTVVVLPQQWNGTYNYPRNGALQHLSLIIENINGSEFTGKMIWQPFNRARGATLKMNGEYITDFGDELEQVRWNNLEDYKNKAKGGVWLKWTETEIISGRNYTVNGWYYAHIREDGILVAVYFMNKTESVADVSKFIFQQVTP